MMKKKFLYEIAVVDSTHKILFFTPREKDDIDPFLLLSLSAILGVMVYGTVFPSRTARKSIIDKSRRLGFEIKIIQYK
jgi:hypothetical protein